MYFYWVLIWKSQSSITINCSYSNQLIKTAAESADRQHCPSEEDRPTSIDLRRHWSIFVHRILNRTTSCPTSTVRGTCLPSSGTYISQTVQIFNKWSSILSSSWLHGRSSIILQHELGFYFKSFLKYLNVQIK